MKEDNSSKSSRTNSGKNANENSDEKLPKSREIYFYVLMGHMYYWIKRAKRGLLRARTDATTHSEASKTAFKLDIINHGAGGDITKNAELMKHIPETSLNNEIFAASENGTPLLTLGDGSKPRVMITSGVHGNELPPQIAALRLANGFLDNLTVRRQCTVYLIPFVAPAASAENDKHFKGENLNLVANEPGNPANDVFKLAQELNITSLADCHGTSTDPAKDSVIYFPKVSSSQIAVHINKNTSSTLLALRQEPGMLVTQCNLHQIPSVICEVESPDGVASTQSIDVAYNQMKAFLNYHGIL